jgi:hypothetical protein
MIAVAVANSDAPCELGKHVPLNSHQMRESKGAPGA